MVFSSGTSPKAQPPDPTGSGEIDYRLARQRVLSEFREGALARHEICDAHPELRRAGAHVGVPTGDPCPVCEEAELVRVTYVFGPRLPAHGRCVSSRGELARLARRKGDFAAYEVEVCTACAWNHLVRAFELRAGGGSASGE